MFPLKNRLLFLQCTASGEAGHRYLDVHIPVVEVTGIEYGCVMIRVRALVVNGVLEMQRNSSHVINSHVQVKSDKRRNMLSVRDYIVTTSPFRVVSVLLCLTAI